MLAQKLLVCWHESCWHAGTKVAGMLACWHSFNVAGKVLLALLARVAGIAGTVAGIAGTVAGIAGTLIFATTHQVAGMLAKCCWHAGKVVAGMLAMLLACHQRGGGVYPEPHLLQLTYN